ncbi:MULTISPECIES: hypothetical protein [Paenibacillus]|uniref:Uncharacterized protein n=1 Tax=Paenibacillus polymyxa TaxID=1406 RepID=A0A378XWH3_PAEPO|nr:MULTISPECIES: hypothetical protein [Paenibacillus]AZH29195.1 hypothetical protein EGM68_10680 [Paenibacillus sp. M-152]MBE7898078.1 hypothetical protein [Paenibacillus polymyxa]MBG9763260.1 hypothetical protein [Paenibacillus polymyxa]MCC3257905.1 hypothetical protein [Paenibacillus polymyxa]PNQ86663.1 hypothetical protein C1T20_08520 [Paenibacillus polymyxa]
MNLKSVFKGVVSSALVVCLIAGVGTLPTFAQSTESSSKDYAVKSGSYSGTEFQAAYPLKKSNGVKVNFWIKNTGNVSVMIKINGDQKRTLAPGKSGHISAPVGSLSSEYKFKAVPTPNGGDISIDYGIAQRD